MAFDLNQFTNDPTRKTTVDNSTGLISVGSNTVLGSIWEMIKAGIRLKVTKIVLYFLLMTVFVLFTGDFIKSKNMSDEVSTKLASEDYFGASSAYLKGIGHRSTITNTHPFYHTNGAKELEKKFEKYFGYKIKLSDIFSYRVLDNLDIMVMKSVAKGKDKKELNLDSWTIFGMSADDYCEDFFDAVVADEEILSEIMKPLRARLSIRRIRNDKNNNTFKCIISTETIIKYIENDRQD